MNLISGTIIFLCFSSIRSENSLNQKYLSTPDNTCDDIEFIVNYHNELRRSVANGSLAGQPKATNMQKIAWDAKLADLALKYSKKMIFTHNSNRKDTRFSVGENLFQSMGSNSKNTDVEWKKAIDSWFNEYKLYTFVPTVPDPASAHYTQLIWADTIYVGCGTTQFLNKRNWIIKIYVCNYGPSGNWYGEYPYTPEIDENTEFPGMDKWLKTTSEEGDREIPNKKS